jgi:PP-loop superfamily ATP-utilizing enzyme
MSWGCQFTADIYISREHFSSEYELDEKIQEVNEYIQQTRTKILMACMGGKDSFYLKDCEDNECDSVDVVYVRVNEMLDWLLELEVKLHTYQLLKENFETKENV